MPLVGIDLTIDHLWFTSLILSNCSKQTCVDSFTLSDPYKVILVYIESRNDPSPKSEVVHETKFSLNISYSKHV